jgi:hypothetical protein
VHIQTATPTGPSASPRIQGNLLRLLMAGLKVTPEAIGDHSITALSLIDDDWRVSHPEKVCRLLQRPLPGPEGRICGARVAMTKR